MRRFQREARAMAQLQHPNIVKVYGLGETPGGLPFFVMEYVDGETLREVIRSGRVEPARAMEILVQVCDALEYAHTHGVIHRDIKPGNIFLDRTGRVKVGDFGLAKVVGYEDSAMAMTMTRATRGAMGTIGYIAPEQMEHGSEIDHRADIYSVGVTLYEMLTGELPRGAFKPPSATVPGMDRRMDEVVVRAMLNKPGQRYQQVSEIRSSLELIRDDPGGEIPLPEGVSSSFVAQRLAAPMRAATPVAKTEKKRRGALWAGAVVTVLGIAGATGYFLFGDRSEPAAPPIVAVEAGSGAPGATPPPQDAAPSRPAVAAKLELEVPPRPIRPASFPLERHGVPGRLVYWIPSTQAGVDRSGTVADVPPGLNDVIAVDTDCGWREDSGELPSHAIALRADGTVAVWGENGFGQADLPDGLTDVVAIAAGREHNLALRADGTVTAWGRDQHGQCRVPPDLKGVVAIAAGGQHSIALRADGTVVGWGNKGSGQTQAPEDLDDAVAITAGGQHSLALREDGTVAAWGANASGETTVPDGLSNVVAIVAEGNLSVALRADRTVAAWGRGLQPGDRIFDGEVAGFGKRGGGSSTAVLRRRDGAWMLCKPEKREIKPVAAPADIPAEAFIQIAFAPECVFAVLAPEFARDLDSLLLAVRNSVSSGYSRPQSLRQAEEIPAAAAAVEGRYVRIELPGDGRILTLAEVEVYAVGKNVAPGGTATQSSVSHGGVPQRAIDGNLDGYYARNGQTHTRGDGSPEPDPWWELDLGRPVSIERVLVFNRLDENLFERLDGFTLRILDAERNEVFVRKSNPGVREPLAFLFGSPSSEMAALLEAVPFEPVDAGYPIGAPLPELVEAFAKLTPGKLLAWPLVEGANPEVAGTIGDLPDGLGEVVAIDVRNYWISSENRYSSPHLLALCADGTVAAWGNNDFGQCEVPAGLANVVAISAGQTHCLALTVDGRIATWGEEQNGFLRVPGELGPAIAIAAGSGHSLALQREGTVAAWGRNYGAQTGVPDGLQHVVAIAASEARSLALTRDGKIVAWGENALWPLVVPGDLGGTVAIAAIIRTEFALQDDGVLIGWGQRVANGLIRIEGVERLGIGWELNHFTLMAEDGAWSYLPSGSSDLVPLPRAAGCTTTAIGQGFVLGIRPVSETERQLAELETRFREKYRNEVHAAHANEMAILTRKYTEALERERKAASQAGNLDAAVMLRDEIRRVQGGEVASEAAPEGASENFVRFFNAYLAQRKQFDATRKQGQVRLQSEYQGELERIERELERTGKTAEAERVRAAMARIEEEPGFWEEAD